MLHMVKHEIITYECMIEKQQLTESVIFNMTYGFLFVVI